MISIRPPISAVVPLVSTQLPVLVSRAAVALVVVSFALVVGLVPVAPRRRVLAAFFPLAQLVLDRLKFGLVLFLLLAVYALLF